MDTGCLPCDGGEVRHAILGDGRQGWSEFWYAITPSHPQPVADQIRTIERLERELFEAIHIPAGSVVSRRFFSSDLATQSEALRDYKARQPVDFFCSQTEQPPAAGVKLAMLGLCLSRITTRSRQDDVLVLDTPIGVRHVFAGHLTDPGADAQRTAEQQTTAIFRHLQDKLAAIGTTLPESVLRTWIYAPHLDADYPGIVKARNDVFDAVNLTKQTHFIASTGIQGGTGNRFVRVFMDAYALVGPGRGPTRYIHAPEFLPPAHQYGVAFERATAVVIQGTEFLFISGTASIDKDGSIVHPGDVVKQTERTLRNIDALLQAAGFGRGDLGSFIVYLRDATDYRFVRPLIDAYAPDLPTVYVKAAVCRPGWLIEIEGTASRLCGREPAPGGPA